MWVSEVAGVEIVRDDIVDGDGGSRDSGTLLSCGAHWIIDLTMWSRSNNLAVRLI